MTTSAAPSASHVTVATTFDVEQVAAAVAGELVRRRLAACAQVETITSYYWWQDEPQAAAEYRVTFKTRTGRAEDLVDAIVRAHTYDTPEVVISPIVGGTSAYLAWIDAETADGAPER